MAKRRFTEAGWRKDPWFRALCSALASCKSEEEVAELGLPEIPDETSEESLEVSSNVSPGDTSEKAITNAAQEDAEVTEDVLSVHEGDEEAAEDGDALKETKDKA